MNFGNSSNVHPSFSNLQIKFIHLLYSEFNEHRKHRFYTIKNPTNININKSLMNKTILVQNSVLNIKIIWNMELWAHDLSLKMKISHNNFHYRSSSFISLLKTFPGALININRIKKKHIFYFYLELFFHIIWIFRQFFYFIMRWKLII